MNESKNDQAYSRKRIGNVSMKYLPNGKLRFFTNDKRKSGCAELQNSPADGIADAVITAHPLNVLTWIVPNETNMEEKNVLELPEELKGKKFRIRKLTPRECFRLMGVDDADIDKIQAAGVSNSGQYKLAGNSIVVDVLFHIFRKMFIETEPDNDGNPIQLTLF